MTSEKDQFLEHAQRIRSVFSASQIVRHTSERAHRDGESVNPGLPVLDFLRDLDS